MLAHLYPFYFSPKKDISEFTPARKSVSEGRTSCHLCKTCRDDMADFMNRTGWMTVNAITLYNALI